MEKVNLVKIGSDSMTEENLKKIIVDAKNWEEQTGEKFMFVLSWAMKYWKEAIIQANKDVQDFLKLLKRLLDNDIWWKWWINSLEEINCVLRYC